MPVPVCCMFYASKKPHIKWSPNGMKPSGGFFWIRRHTMGQGSTRGGIRGEHNPPRCAWGVGAPPTSCPPYCFLDVGSKSSGSRLFQKSRSRRFHSVWTPFDILFLRNSEIGKKQQSWARPPVNRLVPKII